MFFFISLRIDAFADNAKADRFREGSLGPGGPQRSSRSQRDPRRISAGSSKENCSFEPEYRREYNEQQRYRKIAVMKRGESNPEVARIFGVGSFVSKVSTSIRGRL
jgi:hypothetical protein